ncbi:MAG: 1-deoxy-D-xylulose-5-phosphate reductoisomerase [Candidatus Omnitrophota bacterium]
MKKILIFGSSGSIGENALEIIGQYRNRFSVLGLLVNRNIKSLARQVKQHHPRYVCVCDDLQARTARKILPRGVKLFYGEKGMLEFSSLASDIAVMGIVGVSSLRPLLLTMKHSKRIALASKEALVTGGEIVTAAARKYNREIIPVDSEINALFQLFNTVTKESIAKVYITASGGALLGYSKREIKKVTKKDVLNHPTWRMGERITVDCATMVNKGFEVMECHYLFGLDYSKIDILIHRQSFAHVIVNTLDNTMFSCFYPPDMKVPIRFALFYPQRCRMEQEGFSKSARYLSFEKVSHKQFPLFSLVLEAAKQGGNMPVIVNAADEVAVDYFLDGRIKFYDIYKILSAIFEKAKNKKKKVVNLGDLFYWDKWARCKTKELLVKLCG